jgi:uncharacterized membrane protein YczE
VPATEPSDLASSPVAAFREGRLVRRLAQLYLGLIAYGVSMGLVIRAELGVIPWDVFHQGVALRTPLSLGLVVIVTSFYSLNQVIAVLLFLGVLRVFHDYVTYPRIIGLTREPSWVFFEILLPFLAVSAFVFVYRALGAPDEYVVIMQQKCGNNFATAAGGASTTSRRSARSRRSP